MRSTQDLINDLKSESKGASVAILAVGFPKETKFIRSNSDETFALKELNSLIEQGGIPLGFMIYRQDGAELEIETKVLPDHDDRAKKVAHQVLVKIAQNVRDGIGGVDMTLN